MSVFLNFGPLSQAARSARLQIMVDKERSEEDREVDNRVAESAPRDAVAVREVDAQRIPQVDAAERERRGEIRHAAHANDVRQQAHAEEDERVEEHLQLRV